MEILYDAGLWLLSRRQKYTTCATLTILFVICFQLSSCEKKKCKSSIVKKWDSYSFSSIGEIRETLIDTLCVLNEDNIELPFLTLKKSCIDSIFFRLKDGTYKYEVIFNGGQNIEVIAKKTLIDEEGAEHVIIGCLAPKSLDFYPFCYEEGIGVVYYAFRRKFFFLQEIVNPTNQVKKYDFLIKYLKNDTTYFKI
jgi:hypothetical protein